MNYFKSLGIFAVLISFFLLTACIQLGDKTKGLLSRDKSAPAIDIDSLANTQKGLMGRFNSALNNMLLAQSNTLEALGLRDDADLAKSEAEYWGGGVVDDQDKIERGIEITRNSQIKIDEKLEHGQALTGEAKTHLTAATAHYARGMYDGIQLPPEFHSWAEAVTDAISSSSSDAMQASKVLNLKKNSGPALYVAQNLPSLVTVWGDATKNFAQFAKQNDVDVSELDSVIGDL